MSIRERELCPVSEIDWEAVFRGREPSTWERLGNDEPCQGYAPPGIEGLVQQYRAGYPDTVRGDWIEKRLRAWWKGRE